MIKKSRVRFEKPDEPKPDEFAEQRAYFAYWTEQHRQKMERERRNGAGRYRYPHSSRLKQRE